MANDLSPCQEQARRIDVHCLNHPALIPFGPSAGGCNQRLGFGDLARGR
jgi:hypothetical protein